MEDWRPTASMDTLRLRADLLARMRAFFADRGVLEVETPLLAATAATDPHLDALSCRYSGPGAGDGRQLYLQTSPEFAMKRLLAADSGPIYQISKSFRNGEAGRRHNPEFTMLEWYRTGYDHLGLMTEIDDLLAATIGAKPGERITYGDAVSLHAGIEPHGASAAALARCASDHGLGDAGLARDDRDGWLDLLMTEVVEPRLGRGRPTHIYDYPASQASLSRIRPGPPEVAERFEVYVAGVELANGYNELTDAAELRRRFTADSARRRELGLPQVPIDERLVAAHASGLPRCAGVALGFDRLVMLAAGAATIADVMAFPTDRA